MAIHRHRHRSNRESETEGYYLGDFLNRTPSCDNAPACGGAERPDQTARNAGTLNDGVTFTSIQNLAGASANDYFTFENGFLSGTIDGGGGSNTIVGANNRNDWTLDKTNGGAYHGMRFTSIQNFVGGAGQDFFNIMTGGSLGGSIDGAGGTNQLNYSGFDGDVRVDLSLNVASQVGRGVFHMNKVVGSQGNSLLVGDANPKILVGGSGRNLIIGGAGADQIFGGGGDNILIAGTTLHDQNLTALNAIFNEWTSTNTVLADRRKHLLFGGGANGSWLLAPVSTGKAVQTVFDDGAADQLFDGIGVSWFFLHKPEDKINNGGNLLNDDVVSVVR